MHHPAVVRIAWIAVLLVLGLIVLGAYVRLSHAGLGCPDWPVCYGQVTWPVSEKAVARANEAFPERPVETTKAWREQVHRHVAAVLGLLVLALALMVARERRYGISLLLGSSVLVALAIALYMRGMYASSATLVIIAEAVLLGFAWRLWRTRGAPVPVLTLAAIVLQAMLGMWTVTWLLKPVVVMAHLLGGLIVMALLVWIAMSATRPLLTRDTVPALRPWIIVGTVLLALQIALGGWTSANYAALACPDFPTCHGVWWPPADFREAFILWRGIGVDYEGGVLDAPARTAIHLSHRIGAVVLAGYLLWLGGRLFRDTGLRVFGTLLWILLAVQVTLGIANVLGGLPLWVATMHSGVAALLAALFVVLLHATREPRVG
ncbi:MAG TPA: COX15/CtaA family protein [Xanthomonadaceae bacterium]|nr:COX15/CtaA family protein [Xanthomonadaceae bacterium]